MIFRTKIDLPVSPDLINHKQSIVLMGSCFSDNIGQMLLGDGFHAGINPFGVLYNPLSISNGLRQLYSDFIFRNEDIRQHGELFFSFNHHSSFSSLSKTKCLNEINQTLINFRKNLPYPDYLVITLGTAWIYELKENSSIVANCHKLPANQFRHRLMDALEVERALSSLVCWIQEVFPEIRIIFTVSPVRHWKDGAHQNQISKANLLIGLEQVLTKHNQLYYFPAYEIQLDDLRDYRFYSSDMLHPNTVAVNYIYGLFAQTFFNSETQMLAKEILSVSRAMEHRVFFPDSEANSKFRKHFRTKIDQIMKEHPYLNLQKAIEFFTD